MRKVVVTVKEVAKEEGMEEARLVLDICGYQFEIGAQHDEAGLRLDWKVVDEEKGVSINEVDRSVEEH